MVSFTPASIASLVAGRLVGDGDLALTGLAEIGEAVGGELTFVGESGYAPRWAVSKAAAALVTEGIELEPGDGRALIFVDSADLAMAKVLDSMAPPAARPSAGVHPSATVDPSAEIANDAVIGPACVIGPNVVVGSGTVLQAHVTLMDNAKVGRDCVLWPNVVIRERCEIGDRCVLEPGVVLGADGFGYRPDFSDGTPKIVKVPHLGNVVLGNDVELGANVTVDRGKFGPTTIGHGTKIDNQSQIGHNCKIGQMVMISGCCAMAGSVTVGDGSLIGGSVNIRDHVKIGSGCRIAGGAGISGDVPDGEEWLGYNASPAKDAIRELMAMRKLPRLLKDFKQLKQRVDKAEQAEK